MYVYINLAPRQPVVCVWWWLEGDYCEHSLSDRPNNLLDDIAVLNRCSDFPEQIAPSIYRPTLAMDIGLHTESATTAHWLDGLGLLIKGIEGSVL